MLFRAGDQDRERPGARTRWSAADRRIQECDPALSQTVGDRLDCAAADRRCLDVHPHRLAADHAAVADSDIQARVTRRHRRDDDLAHVRELERARCRVRAQISQRLDRLGIAVAHRQVDASVEHPQRHRLAHVANTDQSYFG